MLLRRSAAALAISAASAPQAHSDELEMWAPRSDVAACERVGTPEEAARLFGISRLGEDEVTRISMASGDVIWSFFVPAASLPRRVRRATRMSWPRGFLLFEARRTEQDCLWSSQGVFSDLAVPRRLPRRQSSIP